MSIRPIDLQTNMTQMLKVGDNEHARNLAVEEQQHILSRESDDKSKKVNEHLDELKKTESSIITDREKKEKDRRGREQEQTGVGVKEKKVKPGETAADEHMGRIIDVLK